MIQGRHTAFRSLLIGFLALVSLMASMALLKATHLLNLRIVGTPLPTDLILLDVLIVAVVIGRVRNSSAWLHGLLAGIGLAVPGFVIALYIIAPDLTRWRYMLGLPSTQLWIMLVSVLLTTSMAAQAVAWWLSHRRLLALSTAAALVACVVAVCVGGFRIEEHLYRRAQALQAANAGHEFDMPLPNLALTNLDGTPISEFDHLGHITVLDFWGTWCNSCIAELPSLEAIYRQYSQDAKVRFFLVNPEIEGDTPEKIRLFLKHRPTAIPIALDPGRPYFELSSRLHIQGLPMLIIVDQRGHIRFCEYGFETGEKTKQLLVDDIQALSASTSKP